jgi:hypothetical protein
MGTPADVAVDPWNNLFVLDTAFPRVRAVCNNTSGGYCAGKSAGNVYHFAGTGTAGDGANDTTANAAAIGLSYGIVADSLGNVFFGDTAYRRVRVACVDATAGYCAGLVSGRSYRAYGNGGALTDSASNLAGSLMRLDTPSRDGLTLSPDGDLFYAGSSGTLRLFFDATD